MGDRGQVHVLDSYAANDGVYLYAHWGGSELPHVVRRALKKQWRWGDGCYLARIIFCEMIRGQEAAETGFGICDVQHDDIEWPLVHVDTEPDGGLVRIGEHDWTFKEYIELTEDQLDKLYREDE